MTIAAIALFVAAPVAVASGPTPPAAAMPLGQSAAEDPDAVAERFFSAWRESGTDAALNTVRADFATVAGAGDLAERFRPNFEASVRAYGKIVRWEKVASDTKGSLIRRDIYLVQHEHFVTRWIFIFGHTNEGWVIQHWGFADQPEDSWFD